MLGAFYTGLPYPGQSDGLVFGVDLVVADLQHGHLLDSFAVTQAHTLVGVPDLLHAHALDGALILTEHKILVVNDALHAHQLDGTVLTQAHTLAIAELYHIHGLDAIALIQQHALAVADLLHAHLLDTGFVSITQTVEVQDLQHGHVLDTIIIQILIRETPLPPDVINRLPYGRDDKIIPRGQVIQSHPGFAKNPADLPLIKRVGDDKPLIKH